MSKGQERRERKIINLMANKFNLQTGEEDMGEDRMN